MGPTSITI